ncbi:hypothetical protein [Xanthomarina sp. F2636L]|uniref:hypothetical protein n=1 Tax=Xanthomarina sp. F2636L TaxID=2996018 RepID=UPI00225DD867|nr:hypothetical protein [Xanthomarina sp. F2636L]MCX7552094.1 hypothetical protein [Xanthomarina sp. F2636L]
MKPKDKELAEKVIKFFKDSDKAELSFRAHLIHLFNDKDKSIRIMNSLRLDFKLIDKNENGSFRLTDKGHKFTTFAQLEKDSKNTPLTLYNKIRIGLTVVSLGLVFIFGYLNYSLNQDKTDLDNQNNVLISDLARCTDSLNLHKEKALLKMQKTSSDKEQSNSYLDVKND